MAILTFFALGAVAILVDSLWVAIFSARPNGRFAVVRDTPTTFSFETQVGTYTISADSKSLNFTTKKSRGQLKFQEIKGIEYRVEEKYALLEELFFGLDLTDTLSTYGIRSTGTPSQSSPLTEDESHCFSAVSISPASSCLVGTSTFRPRRCRVFGF